MIKIIFSIPIKAIKILIAIIKPSNSLKMKRLINILTQGTLLFLLVFGTSHALNAQSKAEKKARMSMKDTNIKVLPKDSCCQLSYPAERIGVAGEDLFEKQFDINSFSPAPNAKKKYKLTFAPTADFKDVSQGYIDYVQVLYPCATKSGAALKISKGNFGPGHTAREMVPTRYIVFNAQGNSMAISHPSNFWNTYYDRPTTTPPATGVTESTNNGLEYNEIYSLSMGFWIEGCEEKYRDCLWYANQVNFRVRADTNPIALTTGNLVLELLNDRGEVIGTKIVKEN